MSKKKYKILNLYEDDIESILIEVSSEKIYNKTTNISNLISITQNMHKTFPDGSPVYDIIIETENKNIIIRYNCIEVTNATVF
jgi:hypothetical protein